MRLLNKLYCICYLFTHAEFSEIGKKDAGSFWLRHVGLSKCMLNSDFPVLYNPALVIVCEVSRLFCLKHSHSGTKASILVLAKMLSFLLCPQNPILTSVYCHLDPNGDLVGLLLYL